MQIADVRGQQCPAPLIATRKLLKETVNGGSFEVITGSRNALDNISRFLRDNMTEFRVREENNAWIITITKNKEVHPLSGDEN